MLKVQVIYLTHLKTALSIRKCGQYGSLIVPKSMVFSVILLDDPVWDEAEFQGNFIQRVPDTGTPPIEKTEIAIIYDDENVYFGVRLYDSEPDKIRITEMRRDGDKINDDRFEIVLDTFHDHQSAYNFIVNASGSNNDAIIREDGRIRNSA